MIKSVTPSISSGLSFQNSDAVSEVADFIALPSREMILAYLRHAPVALSIREINRVLAFQTLVKVGRISVDRPVLDVGCGDAFWWTVMGNLDGIFGVDILPSELSEAKKKIHAEYSDIANSRPFEDVEFKTIIGNCSLEHVRDLNAALRNMRKAAASDSTLVLFVPSPNWAYHGRVLSFLLRKLPRLGMMVSGALNGFFQHWHLYEPPVWKGLLDNAGWKVEKIYTLGNKKSEFLYRLFLLTSFPAFIVKQLIGKYPNRLLKYFPDFLLLPWVILMEKALSASLFSLDNSYDYEYVILAKSAESKPE